MRTISFAAIAATIAGAILACVAPDTQASAPLDSLDAAAEAETDAGAGNACSAPVVDPACSALKPAPKSAEATIEFIRQNAMPLRCARADQEPMWDLRPLVDLFGANKIFMLGEAHGSNELGIVSSLVFRELASKGLVNVLAFELSMDFDEYLQHYLEKGEDQVIEGLFDLKAKNFYGSLLTKVARELAAKGTPLRIHAVDAPYSPESSVAALKEIANKLTTQKNRVLATLPKAADPPTADDLTKADAYFDEITAHETEICAELSVTDCERLDAMTHALWVSTYLSEETRPDVFAERREEVIYYNVRTKLTAPADRMFLHMGSNHTNKYRASVGKRMSDDYELTKGKVFSVAPAFGNGSVVYYGAEMPLEGRPTTIVAALGDQPAHPAFISTTRPSAACEENPFGAEMEELLGTPGRRFEVYDGYIHYGKLTSEKKPEKTGLSRTRDVAGRAAEAMDRVEALDRAALRVAR